MWYAVMYLILALWVLLDALKRKAGAIPWAIGTLLLGPFVLPLYLAKRPLKAGEVREGGTAWNVLKTFALFWTLLMVVAAVMGLVGASKTYTALESNAERTGAAIGTTLGLGLIGALWFFPMVGALVLGLFLKKSSVVETGPTGPLVPTPEEAA
jgi:hypothetical protein